MNRKLRIPNLEDNQGDAASSPIDPRALDQIRALKGEGGSDLVGKIIDLFLRHAPTLVATLGEAIDRNDAALLERTAHSLKSSSANIGGLHLSRLCGDLELAARGERIDGSREMVRVVGIEFTRIMRALNDIRGEDHDDPKY